MARTNFDSREITQEMSMIPGIGHIGENSDLIALEACSDGFYKTGAKASALKKKKNIKVVSSKGDIKKSIKIDMEKQKRLIESDKNLQIGRNLYLNGDYNNAIKYLKKVDDKLQGERKYRYISLCYQAFGNEEKANYYKKLSKKYCIPCKKSKN